METEYFDCVCFGVFFVFFLGDSCCWLAKSPWNTSLQGAKYALFYFHFFLIKTTSIDYSLYYSSNIKTQGTLEKYYSVTFILIFLNKQYN